MENILGVGETIPSCKTICFLNHMENTLGTTSKTCLYYVPNVFSVCSIVSNPCAWPHVPYVIPMCPFDVLKIYPYAFLCYDSHSSHIFSICLVAQHFIPYPLPKVLLFLAYVIEANGKTIPIYWGSVQSFQMIFFGVPTKAYHKITLESLTSN
jgi:hypothetical protein